MRKLQRLCQNRCHSGITQAGKIWNNAAFLLQQAIVSTTMQVEERKHCGKAEAGMRDKRKILGSRLVILFYIFFLFYLLVQFYLCKIS